MKLLMLLSAFLLLARKASSSEVHCDYRLQSSHYKCDAKFLSVETKEFILTGNHLSGFNSATVQVFSSSNLSVSSFPQDLQKMFPNLKEIDIENAGLTRISKDDLRQTEEKLTFLSLRFNKISVIDSDLFIYNPNLATIDLFSNQIKIVGKGAFEILNKLTSMDFEGNSCLSEEAFNDRMKVLALMQKIVDRC